MSLWSRVKGALAGGVMGLLSPVPGGAAMGAVAGALMPDTVTGAFGTGLKGAGIGAAIGGLLGLISPIPGGMMIGATAGGLVGGGIGALIGGFKGLFSSNEDAQPNMEQSMRPQKIIYQGKEAYLVPENTPGMDKSYSLSK